MRLFPITLAGALTLASVAGATGSGVDFRLRQVDRTMRTVTLAWNRQPSAGGYEFSLNGVVVSRSFDPSITRAIFWRGSRYGVQVLWRRADGTIVRGARATLTAGANTGAIQTKSAGTGPRQSKGIARPSKPQATSPVSRSKTTQRGRLIFVPARRIDFKLRLVSQTPRKVTFAWQRQPGIDGYGFLRNGIVVSRTFDRTVTRATFWKGSRYAVDLLRVRSGRRVKGLKRAVAVPTTQKGRQRFIFLSSPPIDFRLRLVAETSKTITFAWKRQLVADGFQFVRNGVVVSRTFKRSTTRTTFWKGSHYAVVLLRVSADKRVIPVTRAVAYTKPLSRTSSPAKPAPGSESSNGSGTGTPSGPGGSSSPSPPPPSSTSPPPSPPRSPPPPPPPSPPTPTSDQFPNPSTTGTPSGWAPQTVTSSTITVSQNGAVLQDVRLTDGADIIVTGQNVTLRRVELQGGNVINQPGSACGNGLLVEDSSFLGPDLESGQQPAIQFGGYTARRVEIQDRHEGFRVSSQPACGPVVIEDSFARITPPSPCGDWHGDGIQGYDGSAVTVRNVTIDMRTSGCYGTAPFFYPRNQGNTGPATIDRLLVMGQGYPFRLGMQGTVRGLRIVDKSWVFSPVDVYCPDVSSWEAKIVTIDSNYNVTSVVRDQACTGTGT